MATYANPGALITTDELATRLDDRDLAIVEVDEDTTAYEKGHIPGAIGLNWQLDLHAPREEERSFRPVPGMLGRDEPLDDSLRFAGVRTDEGTASRGEASIEFSADGTAAYTEILLDDDSGRRVEIEVLPLAESVRVFDAES